jgi:hypothetical protein
MIVSLLLDIGAVFLSLVEDGVSGARRLPGQRPLSLPVGWHPRLPATCL